MQNNVLQMLHTNDKIKTLLYGRWIMNKNISMSIRVTEEELEKLKQAARLEKYASYSEFIRRTALIEASKIIEETTEKNR